MSYREQYWRMKRWYARLEAPNAWKPTSAPGSVSDYWHDNVLAFFEVCFHFREWIKNDPGELDDATRKAAVEFAKSSEVLKLCHDLAVGSKHLAVDRPLTDSDPEVSAEKTMLLSVDPNGAAGMAVRFVVRTNEGTRSAIEFAADCVGAWETFLRERNILPTSRW